MTLTIILAVNEGMVFATDSRGTIGDPRGLTAQNDSIKKQYKLDDNTIVQMSGSNEAGAIILDEIKKWRSVQQSEPDISTIMTQLRTILRNKYQEWFPSLLPFPSSNQQSRPALNVTIGGYELVNGSLVERIYLLQSQMDFAPMLFNTGICITGVTQYATYLTLRLYSKDMSLEGAKRLAAFVITETASQDGKVGGPIQMMEIRPNNPVREISNDEIGKIVKKNERINLKLKNLFRN
jgi:20S proteasome alpha/beta subunit